MDLCQGKKRISYGNPSLFRQVRVCGREISISAKQKPRVPFFNVRSSGCFGNRVPTVDEFPAPRTSSIDPKGLRKTGDKGAFNKIRACRLEEVLY